MEAVMPLLGKSPEEIVHQPGGLQELLKLREYMMNLEDISQEMVESLKQAYEKNPYVIILKALHPDSDELEKTGYLRDMIVKEFSKVNGAKSFEDNL